MKQIVLFIGPSIRATAHVRALFQGQSKALARQAVSVPEWSHDLLYHAVLGVDQRGVAAFRRAQGNPVSPGDATARLNKLLLTGLRGADTLVLCAGQLGSLLAQRSDIQRVHDLLSPHADEITVVIQLEEQARMLAAHYADQVLNGRRHPLDRDLALVATGDWWDGALALRQPEQPYAGLFNDLQDPPFWLDFERLAAEWAYVFGALAVTLLPLDPTRPISSEGAETLRGIVPLCDGPATAKTARIDNPPSAASLARIRQFNDLLIRYCQTKQVFCPHDLWREMTQDLCVPGPPIMPGSLCAVSRYFSATNQRLIARYPALKQALIPDPPLPAGSEADPTNGYRASQYLTAYAHRIRRHATPIAEKTADAKRLASAARKFDALVPTVTDAGSAAQMLARVKANHQKVMASRLKPHNRIGTVNEDRPEPPYTARRPRTLPHGSTGNVVVGCMKNEAPYIVEWIAYHRAIGIHNFLIYTNDCTDGTDDVLGRLQEMGHVHLRNNNDWKGNSPQQHALNRALREPVIQQADWIAHIDVDEFINIRTGNGTLDDLFSAVPDATNIAMTWRLFGHNDITDLCDELVIDQFDGCAPKYCPKPHTVWGFKTLFRNIGAYGKISCHRPNKLSDGQDARVKWVSGSGKDITGDLLKNGWRSSTGSIGYDLVQLNHYALRSADSFLIKRQRGRALHVDRSIGINYWIRMDWSRCRDVTIKRNIPRVRAEYDRLMQDEQLRRAHAAGLSWHRAKASDLHATPEFAELYRQALAMDLDDTERVAYALALDMES